MTEQLVYDNQTTAPGLEYLPISSTAFEEGDLVGFNETTGYAVKWADTDGHKFMGTAERATTTSDSQVLVDRRMRVLAGYVGAANGDAGGLPIGGGFTAQTQVGDLVYCSDQDVANCSTSGNEPIGRIASFEASGYGKVRLVPLGYSVSTPTAFDGPLDLGSTLNVAGTFTAEGASTFTGALDVNNAIDQDHALTAAGVATDTDVTINHATADAAAIDASIAQITTNRTGGVASAVRGRITSLSSDTAGVNYACFEGFCTVGEADADHSLLYTRDAMDHLVTVAASGDGGVTVSANGMTADPETDAEAGFVSIQVGTTVYQIPFYAA